MKSLVLLIAISIIAVSGQNPNPTTTFSNNQILQSPDLYYLYWNYNTQNITFEIHVKNAAWALFGIKGSTYSDVIVAAMFADGTGHYSERTLNSDNTITTNSVLNWFLLDAFTSNNYTVFKFYRNLKLQCNQASTPSLDITTGTNTLIFATGSTFNQNDDSIVVSNPTTAQVNLLPTIATTTQLSCVSPPATAVFNSTPTGYYANSVDLIPGIYRVYWNITGSNVTFEVHCQTTGWVGFGLSPDGEMEKSNVVVGYIATDGSVNFTDRYITDPSPAGIKIATNQSVTLLASGRVNGYTYFKYTRPLKVCDSQHISITQGAPFVIYAYGSTALAPGSDIYYHGFGNRGSSKLNIINVPNPNVVIPSDSSYIDFGVKNVIMPRDNTYYYVQVFSVPASVTQKLHTYMYELILPTVNAKNIHHMLLYECSLSYDGRPQTSHNTFTDTVRNRYCTTAAYGWAVGGELKVAFPKDTAYPIGGNTDYRYIMLEIHYNNPEMAIGYFDSLIVRLYVTAQLRPNELGMLTLGTDASAYGIAIPPGVPNFNVTAYCFSDCMQQAFANTSMTAMTVIGSILHTHLTGVSIFTKIVRNGKDVPLFGDTDYDFNYQQLYFLSPYVNITKGDQLITQCTYNTMSRTGFTIGGLATTNEMCLDFLLYYPRNSFRDCYSVPYLNDYIDTLNSLRTAGDITLPAPLAYNYPNLTYGLTQAMTQFAIKPIPSDVPQKFINLFNTMRLVSTCNNENYVNYGPVSRLASSNEYVVPNVCDVTTTPQTPLATLIHQIAQAISNLFQSIFHFFGWS